MSLSVPKEYQSSYQDYQSNRNTIQDPNSILVREEIAENSIFYVVDNSYSGIFGLGTFNKQSTVGRRFLCKYINVALNTTANARLSIIINGVTILVLVLDNITTSAVVIIPFEYIMNTNDIIITRIYTGGATVEANVLFVGENN